MKNDLFKEPSSFRDNFGTVYHSNKDILRTVNIVAEKNFDILKKKNIFKKSIELGFLIDFKELEKNEYPEKLKNYKVILKTKKIIVNILQPEVAYLLCDPCLNEKLDKMQNFLILRRGLLFSSSQTKDIFLEEDCILGLTSLPKVSEEGSRPFVFGRYKYHEQ